MRFTLLVFTSFLLLPLSILAQGAQDDFEGNGTIQNWFGDETEIRTNFANPFPGGMNSSGTVLKYEDNGGTYANVRFEMSDKFDLTSNPTFSLLIYVPSNSLTGNQNNQISLKLQDGSLPAPWSTQSEIVKNVNLDQWQMITFDFANDFYRNLNPNSGAPITRRDFNRVVLQVNGENNSDQVVAYLDNVTYNGDFIQPGAPSNNSPYTDLVWADEFDTDGEIDKSKWFQQTLLPTGTSWYNGEIQHYTNRIDNSYVENGSLYIMAKRETFTDQGQTKQFTSARLNSKFAFTYGRVEIRAQMPFGVGTWPAMWMLGKNINEPGAFWQPTFGTTSWPACGEIDIMEHWGDNQGFVQSAIHTPSSFGGTINKGGLMVPDVSTAFHVYTLDWYPDRLEFALDGNIFYTYQPAVRDASTWPFDADQYLLLNVAIQNIIASSFTQSPMIVDYVRIYQEPVVSSAEPMTIEGVKMYPNPVKDLLNIELPALGEKISVKVQTPSGQILEEFVTQDLKLNLDWSRYAQGMYVIHLETASGLKGNYKVVKE